MNKVLLTRPIPQSGINLLKKQKNIHVEIFKSENAISRKELLRRVKGMNAILSLVTDTIDEKVMDEAGEQLRVISNMAVGYDNIDLSAVKKRNIIVTNTPGVLTDAVAEHAIALMLATARHIVASDTFIRKGKFKGWGPLMFLGTQLKGKTIGIVGLGRIGAGVAERAQKGMGMKVVYNDIARNDAFEGAFNATYLSLEQLLKVADIISIHTPLLPTTKHLINAKNIKLMKKTAILINTSRGPIIDESALVTALKQKRIAGAGLDVFEQEPKLAPGLTKLPNVILTPHTASATEETRDEMAIMAAQAIIDVFKNKKPKHVV